MFVFARVCACVRACVRVRVRVCVCGGGCLSFRMVLCVGCFGGTVLYVCIEYHFFWFSMYHVSA